MAALAQLLLARPLAADLRRPWETRPRPAARCPRAGSVADLQTSGPAWAPPPKGSRLNGRTDPMVW